MMEIIVTALFVCVLLIMGAGACAALWDRPAIDLDFTSPNIPREQEREPRRAVLGRDARLGLFERRPHFFMGTLLWVLAESGAKLGALPPHPVMVRARKERAQ